MRLSPCPLKPVKRIPPRAERVPAVAYANIFSRWVRRPLSRAAVSLPPSAKRCLPSTVQPIRMLMKTATHAKIDSVTHGSFPSTRYAANGTVIVLFWHSTVARLRSPAIVASVAMNGGSRSRLIIKA